MTIGIDLGGTKIAGAVFDAAGEMQCKQTMLLNGATGDEVGDKIVELIAALITRQPDIALDSVGICVPGIVYSKKGTVWAPNIPGWDNYPLRQRIADGLTALVHPEHSIGVYVESDRTCYILGEVWKGAAKGCDNAIYLAVGTGIGAGILLDGRIIHGANDIVGATGWMALQRPYREEYIPCGCWEYSASGDGIGREARYALRCERNYTGVMSRKPVEQITSHDVFDAYRQGDPIATKVLDNAITLWGMGTANLVSLFNPEKIIFGGGVFGPATMFIDRIYDEACKWGQPISMRDVTYCASQVGSDAALLGAGYLGLKK